MIEFLIFIGLIIIILGLSSNKSLSLAPQPITHVTVTGSGAEVTGSPPDDLSTQFWGMFQNPNIWINGYTIKEVPQNVYFKSNTKLNPRNHDVKI